MLLPVSATFVAGTGKEELWRDKVAPEFPSSKIKGIFLAVLAA
jgi:hypothetical protein